MRAQRVAKQREMQNQRRHRKQCCVLVDVFWSLDAETERRWPSPAIEIDRPIPRARSIPPSNEPVDVHVCLDYPLQDAVPESVRESNFKATTVKDVCLEVRRLYEAIYAEDERLGGITAAAANAADSDRGCLNRGFGPWIWGHDIGDLAIEFIEFEWVTPTHCHANLFIGS